MSTETSFAQLLARVRDGDDNAAAVIFERFVRKLAAHADRHLALVVRPEIDAVDVVQSVYRTFFRRVHQGQFQLDHWGSLWGLLARIAVCKCARAAERRKLRQRPKSLTTDGVRPSEDELTWEIIARDPSPNEIAALNDVLDALLKPLRDSHRQILTLLLDGHTQEETSNRVGCSVRTVRRVLNQAQADLEKLELLESGFGETD